MHLAETEPAPSRLVDQFGGVPWGLPTERWPRCAMCGRAQALIAQLAHAEGRLDLGADGRALYVFHCTECDDFSEWTQPQEVRSAFVIAAGQMGKAPSVPPGEACPPYLCVRVAAWHAGDDGIGTDEAPAFSNADSFERLQLWNDERTVDKTRLGGVPKWFSCGLDDVPTAPWRFALQIDPPFEMTGPIPDHEALGCYLVLNPGLQQQVRSPRRRRPGIPCSIHVHADAWSCDGPNFAEGRAWVFLRDRGSEVPEARFSWART